jgi:DNA-binding CsgD family transcriptional regulator/N-acetylneuraminic acid mutarotase
VKDLKCYNAWDAFMPEINDLSERELEILRLVATGVSNKEIAQQLYISTNTVKVHLRNIFSKIGAVSRTEAAMFAVSNGLVPELQSAGESQGDGASGVQESYTSVRGGLFPTSSIQVTTAEPDRRFFRPIWFLVAILLVAAIFVGYQLLNREPLVGNASPTALTVPTPQTRWRELSQMPTPRSGLALAAYDNKLFAIGGERDNGVTGVVERYDIEKGAWQALASKPTAVEDVDAEVISGKIFVPGGKLANGSMTNVLEIYDPQRDSWSTGSPLPVALSGYALTSFEGRLYLFGGWDGQQYLDVVFRYDAASDQWTQLPSMPVKRAFAGAAASGDRIFVLGGRNQDGTLTTNTVYMPNNETGNASSWTEAAPLPEGRYAMGVTSIAGFVYVVGGTSDSRSELPTMVYLPSNDTWSISSAQGIQPVSFPGVVAVEAFLYSVGGQYGGAPTANLQSYQAMTTIAVPIIR